MMLMTEISQSTAGEIMVTQENKTAGLDYKTALVLGSELFASSFFNKELFDKFYEREAVK